jgi:hypothetical protein
LTTIVGLDRALSVSTPSTRRASTRSRHARAVAISAPRRAPSASANVSWLGSM